MEHSTARFSCPACGQRFAWQPEFAGRTVKCKCGAAFVAQLAGHEMLENRAPPLAVEHQRQAKAAQSGRRPQAANLPPRTGRAVHEMATDTEETGPFRDVYAPIGLLIVGGAARLTQVLSYGASNKIGAAQAAALWICELLLGGVAMFAGVLVAARMMSIAFGPPVRAAMKLLSIWLIAAATAYFVAKIDNTPMNIRGIILAWHVILILYFILLTWLFRMDLLEALVTTVLVTAVQGVLLIAVARTMSPDRARALFFG